MIRLNNDWKFSYTWTDDLLTDDAAESVRLPHNVAGHSEGISDEYAECAGIGNVQINSYLPLHYADKKLYSTVCGYTRKLKITEEMLNGHIFLQFDGCAHIAEVFVNSQSAGKHYGGYTAFNCEITKLVHPGSNHLSVRLDCTENPDIPPFGFVIDYLTYGGLYRDVWLDVRPENYIEDVFVYTSDNSSVHVDITCSSAPDKCRIQILDASGECVSDSNAVVSGPMIRHCVSFPDARIWKLDDPYMYKCIVTVTFANTGDSGAAFSDSVSSVSSDQTACTDTCETCFGVRTAEFRKDGFYLNGQKVFLRGLNRHQSYPYIGYAAPEGLQREDARILKEELSCNAVRTSHYPQSQHFIKACDELGLLVFTEIPGWQHLGDAAWKDHALDMVREMILQYRNHPSIVLWGVRINESRDDDEFYTRTNALAHELDPTRQTSGVRYLEKSHLLEDVYAFNDFSHDGTAPGCRKKSDITPDADKPYLISECNGHMFPTKPFDNWAHRQEQALRHARVHDSALAEGDIAGVFGWCMFDYATHEDFGSGDRICYHGVLDSFRNPKLAAYTYASQGEDTPVLECGSAFDIGEYPAGRRGDIYVFTNADEIRLYKNDRFVRAFSRSAFSHLPHGPILIDDMIGDLIRDEKGWDDKEADLVRKLLISAEKHGFEHLPFRDKLKLLYAHFRYKLSFEQGYALYGKYMGNWGEESVRWRIDAVTDGQVVRSITRAPSHSLHIEARASSHLLHEGDVYDMALVRIRILDEYGNLVPYAQVPLKLEVVSGPEAAESIGNRSDNTPNNRASNSSSAISENTGSRFNNSGPLLEIVGPDIITAEGGMCGTFVRTCGRCGTASLKISSDTAGSCTVSITIDS